MVQGNDTIKRDQVIWHELGHVLMGPSETGSVYLHELRLLLEKHGAEKTKKHVSERQGQYAKVRSDDGNRAELGELLKQNWNVTI